MVRLPICPGQVDLRIRRAMAIGRPDGSRKL
jgi:hypothetical protein